MFPVQTVAFLFAGSSDLSLCCRSCPAVLSTITLRRLSVSTPFSGLTVIHSANDEKISNAPPTPIPHPHSPPSATLFSCTPFKLSVINHTSYPCLCLLSFLSPTASNQNMAQQFKFCIFIHYIYFHFIFYFFCVCLKLQQNSRWQPVIKHITLGFW